MLIQLTHGVLALAMALAPSGAAPLHVDLDEFDRSPTAADEAAERAEKRRLVLEGTVALPGGAPAEGAVVVSTAGGQAVTDAAGRYALDLEVAVDALETRVTAVSSRNGDALVASAQVDLRPFGERVDTGSMELGGGGGCEPSWLPTFGEQPGVSGEVKAMAVYDDGTGTALFVGGDLPAAGGASANFIAKWNGTTWSALGAGLNSEVLALAVHDDGTGPALFVGGAFTTAGDESANHIAKWDGTSWSDLGAGLNSDVLALAV